MNERSKVQIRLAVLALVTVILLAQSIQTLPPEVHAAILESRRNCQPSKATLKPGFVKQKDVNRDGVQDYILDYRRFICEGSGTTFCGTAGCLRQVFASLPDGSFAKVLDENVRGLLFAQVDGHPAMWIGLDASACGRADANPCSTMLYWNGDKFSPAN